MENQQPHFVKCLTNNNIVVITDSNRRYFEKVVPQREDFIFLDQYEQIIGKLEVSPQEAEVYVEAMLEELDRREKQLTEREAAILSKEIELAELEQKIKKKTK